MNKIETKLEARYTEIMLKMLKLTIVLDGLEVKVTFGIKYSLSLHKTNHVYPRNPSSYLI